MVSLNDVYEVYGKWLHVSDRKRIDIVLAVALTRKKEGETPVWLILIGNSGDWKSVQLKALNDNQTTFFLRSLTKNTLINGNPKVRDLAPDLDEKLVLIPEMAQILKLDPKEKAQVWAQLRDLFDGIAGKVFGSGKRKDYTGLKVTIIMGSTPAIDQQILVHQDLGTRELVWRTSKRDKAKKHNIMNMVWLNEPHEKEMQEQLNGITIRFIQEHSYKDDFPVNEEIKQQLFTYATFLTKMRATAEIDSYTCELLGDCNPEEPTRVLKQFKIIYKALKSLDMEYSDKQAIDVIRYLTVSSSVPNRINVLLELIQHDEPLSIKKIASSLRVGYKTVQREINILWNLRMVEEVRTLIKNSEGGESWNTRWEISADDETKSIVKQLQDYIKIINEEGIE